jgi:hypothetical protein
MNNTLNTRLEKELNPTLFPSINPANTAQKDSLLGHFAPFSLAREGGHLQGVFLL